MRQTTGAKYPGHGLSDRRTDHAADEARLGRLLERTYAAREARLTPSDDALVKLNVALDTLDTTPRRQTDHRRLFGACALVALLLLLFSPVARSEFAGSTRNAQGSVVTPISAGAANGRAVPPSVTIATSAGGSIASTERGNVTTHAPVANGTAAIAGVSETPLRDLLARAGIHASDSPSGSTTEGAPPQH